MSRKILFQGDELVLLMAMDTAGCVQTDAGRFYCDMEKDDLPFNSRLPVRIKGEYASVSDGWEITFRVVPAPRTLLIGAVFCVFFLSFLISGNFSGGGLFGILFAALFVNFAGQHKSCVKRFESKFARR